MCHAIVRHLIPAGVARRANTSLRCVQCDVSVALVYEVVVVVVCGLASGDVALMYDARLGVPGLLVNACVGGAPNHRLVAGRTVGREAQLHVPWQPMSANRRCHTATWATSTTAPRQRWRHMH